LEARLQDHHVDPPSPPHQVAPKAAIEDSADRKTISVMSRELATIVIVAVLLVGVGVISLPLNMQAYIDAGIAFISLCTSAIS
jgi:uncharacterized membrane protein YiaA